MSRYMSMFKYAKDAYAGTMSEGPAARADFLRSYTAAQGAEVEAIWYTGGEWDMVMITKGEFDAKTLASQWSAMSTGAFVGAVSFPVFEPEEFQEGFDALDSEYRKPGGS